MSQTSKKVLITGGAGFVGSQLGHLLHGFGHEVILLDDMSFGNLDNLVIDGKTFGTFTVCDIRSSSLARWMEGVDTVFHLAGVAALPVCQNDPQYAFSVNSAGTAHVLDQARRAGVRRVIFSSTSAVYENSVSLSQCESEPTKPDLIYASTKYSAEEICSTYSKNFGMDIIIARFFNVYGPHQDFRRKSPPFTSYIAREVAADRSPVLFNQSSAKRDYVYIKDVLSLLIKMMDSSRKYSSEIYNIGSESSYSVPELYELLCKVSGKSLKPVFRDPSTFWDAYSELFEGRFPMNRERVKKEVYKNSQSDCSRAKKEFGWVAQVSLEEGLRAVYEYAATRRV